MRISILAFLLFSSITFANPITVKVSFDTKTAIQFSEGVFKIKETNEELIISKLEDFEITLPEKGKYEFSFVSEGFTAYTIYPVRMNARKNTIIIRLEETHFQKKEVASKPETVNHFIFNGFTNDISDAWKVFYDKYGVSKITENCVVDPFSYRKAVEQNQKMYNQLTQKFGKDWIEDLPEIPFGLRDLISEAKSKN
ncbi:hypothetical protein SAMN05216480_11653 [Pustulibacterium marinum]|uniref:DUF4369 domain-containing protein n=1 Tax=Pustulibacterium marinum TaxID=1224947 RepID=A0A1I7IHK8_9FLAO|nr:hypothetical protein [Pustulibacterium marinum]SFU72366.1 hypothetical protein SAMN05216480_11653 [Pustulibacterium marinum]